ncbi:hypothetical protein MKW98_023630 [Papaver atlanticum]|uniref:Condensin-2 complex subunit H2 n=1 Tax=Papaver atlanticum TaxID=357466 RepID=A0AAD4SZ73_9MAGN|nr:hypothetical protein MKW98_023630 [Papaver atlanticum]
MNFDKEDGSGSSARFRIVQPLRDPQSNWSVDLAKNLEDYLLRICSGEPINYEEDAHLSVNFAEAALLLQGSIQVYSRKVEYLYTLVLHALDFISQKSQEEQPVEASVQRNEGRRDNQADVDESNELFLGLDDVPVEANNSLDGAPWKDDNLNQFVKPPSNLVVLEGDCFDPTGETGELESYLLSTCDLYEDFILLDPCDAGEIQKFIKRSRAAVNHRASSVRSKGRKTFGQTPSRTGGTGCRKSTQKHNVNPEKSPMIGCNQDNSISQDPPDCSFPENDSHGDDNNDYHGDDKNNGGYSLHESMSEDDTDEDDPWKPLNPHEPGTLKVKPFKKGNIPKRRKPNPSKRISITMQFPIAKLTGIISPEFTEMWEAQNRACEIIRESTTLPLFEQLRQSLTIGGSEPSNPFGSAEADKGNESEHDIPDFDQDDFDMPENTFMDVEEPLNANKDDEQSVRFESTDFGRVEPELEDFEDLCRSHLDDLLASIAETEKQTELATRVSTWKQRIEQTLEDQDLRPPFDIHEYGERVLNKLSLEADSASCSGIPFTDVVKGNEKHDVARTFSALLQLVNNGNVDLVKSESSGGQSFCYTATNPFSVRLLTDARRKEVQLRSSKKRPNSPIKKPGNQADKEKGGGGGEKIQKVGSSSMGIASSSKSSQSNGKFSVKVGKISAVRCTPEGKRRRRSRLIEPVDLQSAG